MVYGLDIGGTKIEIAIFTEHFRLLDRWRVATPTDDYQQFLQTVTEQVAKADQQYGAKAPIGVALPGVVEAQGQIISSNLACLNRQAVGQDLTLRLQRSVALGNDCRLFVLSEALLGAGRHYRRVFGAVLGTGAGGGLCVDGELDQGARQMAGEFGHQSIAARVVTEFQLPLFRCGCGLLGCAETYVSGSGLARLYQHFSQHFGSQQLQAAVAQHAVPYNAQAQHTTYHWAQAYQRQEPAAVRTFDCFIAALGACLAAQILAYDPDIIILGGGLSEIDEILQALPKAVSQQLFAGATVPPIRKAEFGAASGERGAAILGLRSAQQLLRAGQR